MTINLMIKEITSGLGGACIFIVLFFQEMNGWLSLFLAVCSYFAIRFLFPPEHRKILAELPNGISREVFNNFVTGCREKFFLIRKKTEAISKPSFKRTVLHLCDLGDNLVVNFEKDPNDAQMTLSLPDRLERLQEMLNGYIDLSNQKNQSPQTVRALEETEKAVTKAVGKFEQLHHRLLENDAIDLSTNAKTFDNLLDFD